MWLYDGEPDHICLGVKDASPHKESYVVVFQLDSGETRILATRFPAKYVSSWKSHARRYGGVDVTRVLVSRPHHRYEKIKRMLAAVSVLLMKLEMVNIEISISFLTEAVTGAVQTDGLLIMFIQILKD